MDNSACLQTRLQYFGQKLAKQRRKLEVPKFKIRLKKGRRKKLEYEKSWQQWGYLSNLWKSFRNFPYRNNPRPRGLNPRSRTNRNHRQQLSKPYKFDHNLMKRDIDSLDDCFDFIEEPSYGFRVNITQEIPCSEWVWIGWRLWYELKKDWQFNYLQSLETIQSTANWRRICNRRSSRLSYNRM